MFSVRNFRDDCSLAAAHGYQATLIRSGLMADAMMVYNG